jgi:hypothetical protein
MRPHWLNGLQAGTSYYRDTMHPAETASLRQRIYSAYAALIRPHLELIAEGVLLRHEATSGAERFNTTSSYAQASYLFGSVRPFFRYEYQHIPVSDPVLGLLGSQRGPSIGARFELNDFSCLKIQYGRLGMRAGKTTNDVNAQIAIVF